MVVPARLVLVQRLAVLQAIIIIVVLVGKVFHLHLWWRRSLLPDVFQDEPRWVLHHLMHGYPHIVLDFLLFFAVTTPY